MKGIISLFVLLLVLFITTNIQQKLELLPLPPESIEKLNLLEQKNEVIRTNFAKELEKRNENIFQELYDNQIDEKIINEIKFRQENEIYLSNERQLLTLLNYARISISKYSKVFLYHLLHDKHLFIGSQKPEIIQWNWSLYSTAYLQSKKYFLSIFNEVNKLIINNEIKTFKDGSHFQKALEKTVFNFIDENVIKNEVILVQFKGISIIDLFNEIICGTPPPILTENSMLRIIEPIRCNLNIFDPSELRRYRLLNTIYNIISIGEYSSKDYKRDFPDETENSIPFFRIFVIKLGREIPIMPYFPLIAGGSFLVNRTYTSPSYLPPSPISQRFRGPQYITTLIAGTGNGELIKYRFHLKGTYSSVTSCSQYGYPSIFCGLIPNDDISLTQCQELHWIFQFNGEKPIRYPKTGSYFHATYTSSLDDECSTLNWVPDGQM